MPLTRAITRKDRKVRRVFDRFPQDVAKEGTEFFKQAFEKEAWEGKAWKNRKRQARTGARNAPKQRGLLVKSGRLRDSIDPTTISGIRVVIEAGYTVGNRTRWNLAQIHNEGLRPVPQRKFIGDSRTLRKRIRRKLTFRLKKAL